MRILCYDTCVDTVIKSYGRFELFFRVTMICSNMKLRSKNCTYLIWGILCIMSIVLIYFPRGITYEIYTLFHDFLTDTYFNTCICLLETFACVYKHKFFDIITNFQKVGKLSNRSRPPYIISLFLSGDVILSFRLTIYQQKINTK